MTRSEKVSEVAAHPSGAPSRETAGVVAAPPAIFGAALLLSLTTHAFVYPLHLASGSGASRQVVALVMIVAGLAISYSVMRVFARAGTSVVPYRPTTCLVTGGPYRYSRNPDYVGQTMLYIGIAVAANSWWPLLLLPLVLLVVHYGVIRREERYLEREFGREYRVYAATVPRWL
jgi:protein-S-isoprenylcysteine O-methyltransferase Ste14